MSVSPKIEMSPFALEIMSHKYAHDKKDGSKESWKEISQRVPRHVLGAVDAPKWLIDEVSNRIHVRQFIPGGRYLYASGRPFHQTQNCLLMRAEDSREGWAQLMYNSSMGLMSGAGIGVDYSPVRAEGKPVRKTGGVATGPVALMQMVNEAGRGIVQGGSRRAAIWAGLSWKHSDIHKFINIKNWSKEVRSLKETDFSFPATLDMTNVSVQLDDEFFTAFSDESHLLHAHATSVYWATIERMLKTGEPGFSVDTGKNAKETLRNACTEVSSADDSDICNLGSINLARIGSLDEFKATLESSVAFLLAGTVYSDVPYAKVDQIRTKNRRLGLGLMGVSEWLAMRGRPYGPDAELETYLKEYERSTSIARGYADKWDLSRPVKTRAIAPTGTIGIIAETTTGIEPIFCVAYKRRYLKGRTWHHQYVVDPTAKNLVEHGVDPDRIEDAYSLPSERRVAFQAWMQQYVDHGISSTINLPAWGSEENNSGRVTEFGLMLIKYLPKLRGITCYPDGARGGQPLTSLSYRTAMKHVGEVFVEAADICDITKGGSCGA
jgi:ribonucleoside-diphosphate reductase alpha chain